MAKHWIVVWAVGPTNAWWQVVVASANGPGMMIVPIALSHEKSSHLNGCAADLHFWIIRALDVLRSKWAALSKSSVIVAVQDNLVLDVHLLVVIELLLRPVHLLVDIDFLFRRKLDAGYVHRKRCEHNKENSLKLHCSKVRGWFDNQIRR